MLPLGLGFFEAIGVAAVYEQPSDEADQEPGEKENEVGHGLGDGDNGVTLGGDEG